MILRVTPTVFCSAEQSFSVLRKSETNRRSIMGQDRLSHLVLLYIKRAYVSRADFQPIVRPKNVGDLFWIL